MLAVLIVAALFLGKLIIERMADTITKLVEDKLRRNEELHKSFLAFTSAVDTDLRTKRIPVYAELWKKTGVLPKWPRNTELEYQDLHQFTGELRKWYFEDGSIYFSESARNAYFEVQESIKTTLEGHKKLF